MRENQQLANLNGRILLVDDDTGFTEGVRRMLITNDCTNVTMISDSRRVMDEMERGSVAAVLLDWIMPHLTGAELLGQLVSNYPAVPVIIMTAVADTETIVTCIRQGAFDYITKPIDENRLLSCLGKAVQVSAYEERIQRLTAYLQGAPLARPEIFSEILTRSPKMINLLKTIESVAPTRTPILITGETGVGKELVARAIHRASNLSGQLVPVNVAGLDDSMFSDTLFGHVRGAYTGAMESREGLVSQAAGGTLFFDEIGDMGPESQVKLLRLLQEQEYFRIGSDTVRKCKARFIAASNRDFDSMRTNGSFRNDLYYRVGGFRVHVPPLRERPEDIPYLFDHFLEREARQLGREVPIVPDRLVQALQVHPFVGNVRELINMVRQALVTCSGRAFSFEDFPGVAMQAECGTSSPTLNSGRSFLLQHTFDDFPKLDELQALLIEEALKHAGGSKTLAARMLGMSRTTLNKKLNGEVEC